MHEYYWKYASEYKNEDPDTKSKQLTVVGMYQNQYA